MEKETMTVYKVYDDMWETVMGEGQLIEFATNRMDEDTILFDEDEIDEMECSDRVKNAYREYVTNDIKPTDIDTVIEIINFATFDVDVMELY